MAQSSVLLGHISSKNIGGGGQSMSFKEHRSACNAQVFVFPAHIHSLQNTRSLEGALVINPLDILKFILPLF